MKTNEFWVIGPGFLYQAPTRSSGGEAPREAMHVDRQLLGPCLWLEHSFGEMRMHKTAPIRDSTGSLRTYSLRRRV